MSNLSGQTALITGAATGIGKAIASRFAQHGARLFLADINLEGADEVARALEMQGAKCRAGRLDISRSHSCDEIVDQAAAFGDGALEILVQSAGIGMERAFLDTSDEEWARIIDVDLTGTFYINRACGRFMANSGYGRIINLSSTAGLVGGTGRAAYGAAKGGVIMLTWVLAVELAAVGVTVNALAPGAIETDLVARMHSEQTRRVYRRAIPQDRYGTPEETAAAALFLASREAAYVNGHVLAVDGGFLAAGVMHEDRPGTGGR